MRLYDMKDPSLLLAPPIERDDFLISLTKTKPTVALEDLRQYEHWTEEFGQEGAAGFIKTEPELKHQHSSPSPTVVFPKLEDPSINPLPSF
jgi:hypothetical protein